MSDDRLLAPAAMQDILRKRLTRRGLLKGAGAGVAGFSLASFLAACGGGGGGGDVNPKGIFSGEAGDSVEFANWPFYIDQAKDKEGNVYYPSLKQFKEETGIDVTYSDVIESNDGFYGKIQPQLAAGDPTGWDIIVISNSRQFTLLTQNEWVYPLDTSMRPNFDKYAEDFALDPAYDKGNKYSMAWQSGVTGIGVNKELVNGEITKMDDLANPNKVGKNLVGMIKGDMPDWVMVNLGIDPETSGPDEWKEAAAWLMMQQESGTVRGYYGQEYAGEMTAGNVSATMAWSGDVLYYKLWVGYDNLEFVLPTDNLVLIWIDNMLIPVGSKNPVGAAMVMDWYYDPKIAIGVTEWILYMSPVKGMQDLINEDAAKAEDQGYKGYANKLYATANSEFLFPSQELLDQTRFARTVENDAEAEEWDNIFLPISQG
ncbi:MAG: spermidine/putrescine ABC transporter substrate-binding protein [Actinomycetota bacterium]|nr:spermidine/putrescine ABC transporter substrate-binding protein [Actinomycetota bacterium]